MKKLNIFISSILISVFLISFLLISKTYAQTPSPSKSLIDNLTSKIASRVAQLKLVEKRGIIGKVTDASSTQITTVDLLGNTRFVDVDEFTKFASSSSKTFGISDIEKGSKLGVLGLYNKDSRRILARFVEVLNLPEILHGVISEIDSENFALSIKTEKNNFSIDVETSTRTFSFDSKEGELVRSGFSRLKIGQNIIVVGFPDLKEESKISATRIIIFPDIPGNPKIKLSSSGKNSENE
ncbi:MAG: hypothetical protein A2958_02520 [Candidatus Levybacteria bacterium RIFCSPLOWO2_01_FULL_38_13]|nr:MAG: hypothetical protein A2629_02940 [Candidatus Levybacteria bacterium RIFCSPHIGHO2_01_FULL_41_15]OGH35212.1 MAG: hypothetical protein A2958_02520 [Candidatus Levybacteria bacterium RIFCSPLOWO2_01_FULL_38_13]